MNDKEKIRAEIIEKRNALSPEFRDRASFEICKKVESIVGTDKSVFVYKNMGSEVGTEFFFEKYEKISIPRCYKHGRMDAVSGYTELEVTPFGTTEPIDGKATEDIFAVIVPGLAFSESMDRIGYGAGYYDRFLEKHKNALKIAVCFDFQVRNDFSAESHDVKMDYIVTERRILH